MQRQNVIGQDQGNRDIDGETDKTDNDSDWGA